MKKKKAKMGLNRFIARLKIQEVLYGQIADKAGQEKKEDAFMVIEDNESFDQIIKYFGPSLDPEKSQYPLNTVYDIGFHKKTGALVVANKGATLFSLSPKKEKPYITRHLGFSVYMPGLGVEMVNVGIVGDIYQGPIVLRSESACTPSFLFGSQRCNCAHQWDCCCEVASSFNPLVSPDIECGHEFEKWVQQQFSYKNRKHYAAQEGQGFILMHLDSQNGMGSGYTKGEFSGDLFSRASLRHRGEYTSEQVHQTTMAGGFTAIGITPDPRGQDESLGYKVTPIILDWLDCNKNLLFLSNNPFKIRELESSGYLIDRIKMVGSVNVAGSQEAEQRGSEFEHFDIDGKHISFEEEFERLLLEIKKKLENKSFFQPRQERLEISA